MSTNTEIQEQHVVDLRLKSFRYAQAEKPLFRDLDLKLRPGTLTVIVGGSGSGKSTLGAVLAGILPRPGLDMMEATFVVEGQRIQHTADSSPRIDSSAWAQHIGFLPQDPGEYLSGIRETVKEELVFSLENRAVSREAMEERIKSVVEMFDIGHLLNRDPSKLSGGQERIAALAALVMDDPQVLVLDEPLAGLDAVAREAVLNAIDTLTAANKTVLLLCRDSGKLPMSADDVFCIRESTLVSSALPEESQEVDGAWPSQGDCSGQTGEVLLSFRNVSLGYGKKATPIVENFSFDLHAGECVALTGPNGSGKTTLLKAATGLIKPIGGSISRHGKVGLLLQNPNDQLFERTVRRDIGYGLPNDKDSLRRIDEVLERLTLTDLAEVHPYELPMSKRKLVALGTVLVHEPKILLMDEPEEPLDQRDGLVLREVIRTYTESGGTVLLTHHQTRKFHPHTALNLTEPSRKLRR